MGDAIRVRWTDGPTVKMVDAIVDQYSAGKFDGMTDYYDYRSTGWTEAFGSAKYISTKRDYSDSVIAWAKKTYGEEETRFTPEWQEQLSKLSIIRTK